MRPVLGDASGAVADLGVLIPISAALVLENGFDPATVLVCAGCFYIAAGWFFVVPVPVQPIKAAAAITIANDLDPAVLSAAGIILGVTLLGLGSLGASNLIARVFTPPIVRGLQLGVGLILLNTALGLLDTGPQVMVASAIAGVALVGAARHRLPVALIVVAGGFAFSLLAGREVDFALTLWEPHAIGNLSWSMLSSALVLLVIPQLPLTFGNAVAAVVDLENEYFGKSARRVTPRSVSLSCGAANVVAGALGGMPMCHGSNGLTAHYRAGARTSRMNLLIGGCLVALGLFAGAYAFGLLALVPTAVLAGLLAFTGVGHGALLLDQRGSDLVIALLMGVVGFATSNLALALGLGLSVYWGGRAIGSLRHVQPEPSE